MLQDAPRDQPRHHADGPFLQKQADAEARVLAEGQREIDPAVLVKLLDVLSLAMERTISSVSAGVITGRSSLDDLRRRAGSSAANRR